ncbi:MAG: FtsX-like permease family protein [Acidimicrobiales bacterium]
MRGHSLRVASYWLRTNFARRWSNYLTVTLIIGLLGGVSIGSLTAARRTESSFTVFLKHTNPSDISLLLYAPNETKLLSRLPHVKHVETMSYNVFALPAGKAGAPRQLPAFASGDVVPIGSLNGEYFNQDKPAVVEGRMANPRRANQFVLTTVAARLLGWHVGQSIPMYFYTTAQTQLPGIGTAKVKPTLRLTMHLVGTVVFNNEVVLDEVDRYPTFMLFTPKLTRQFAAAGVDYDDYAMQLQQGARDVPAVEREIIADLPKGTSYQFHVTSVVTGQVDRSIEPEAIALGVFGLITLLATLVIAGSLVARVLQSDEDDMETLRALGGSPAMMMSTRLLGVLGAVVAGAVLSVVAAILLSPFSPIGPVRAVYPDRGISFDWHALGFGFVALVIVLGVLALVLARRHSLRTSGARRAIPVSSRAARFVTIAGLPLTAVVGVRFALEPGRRRDAAPVRSALLGAVVAVTIVVATLTFGSSLNTLISHPALYGWNWNYALTSSSGSVPSAATSLLNGDPYVKAWSPSSFPNIQIDGVTVPVLAMPPHSKVTPPLLSGHEVDAGNQIVLGEATMQELHKKIGDTVIASYGTPRDAPIYLHGVLTIVGTATLPAVGNPQNLHVSMGTGGIVSNLVESSAMRKALASPYPTLNGPPMVFVRLRYGVSIPKALSSLKKIATAGNLAFTKVPDGGGDGDSVVVLPVQYPAEIENYRSIGAIPDVLALALAVGAVAALAITLVASVRRRRRDLALLRTFGFTRRQLMSTIAWQASVAGVIGIVLGLPLGILTGRSLWIVFARYIDAVPQPTVPLLSMIVVVVASLVLANLVAAMPGRNAARTSTAQVLRGE